MKLFAIASVILLASATPVAPDANVGVYSAVVSDVRHALKGVGSVRIFVAEKTTTLTPGKLERLAAAGWKDDPPNALALAKRERGFEKLLAETATTDRLPAREAWSLTRDEPRSLRCAGVNWELERDAFIRFSRPAFIGAERALVYAYVRDCISFGHTIVVLQKDGSAWKVVMSYEIAGAGE